MRDSPATSISQVSVHGSYPSRLPSSCDPYAPLVYALECTDPATGDVSLADVLTGEHAEPDAGVEP